MTTTQVRPLYIIARDIRRSWKHVNYAAAPYLEAMFELDKVTDSYGCDSADDIVRRFLSNASTFKGSEARFLKTELRALLKGN